MAQIRADRSLRCQLLKAVARSFICWAYARTVRRLRPDVSPSRVVPQRGLRLPRSPDADDQRLDVDSDQRSAREQIRRPFLKVIVRRNVGDPALLDMIDIV